MKRIHFHNLGSLKSVSLLVLTFVMMLTGYMIGSQAGKALISIGFLSTALHFMLHLIYPFIFRNYMAWNKLGMQFKIETHSFKSIKFKNIRAIVLENGLLSISQENELLEYNMSQIRKRDIDKLITILELNANLKTS